MKNPPWVREEAILLLDLYMQCGRQQLSATDERVIELSNLLRKLPFHPTETRTDSFRNPKGISMKMGNLLALDPLYSGIGLESVSQMDEAIWEEFAENPEYLHSLAQQIRAQVSSCE